MPKPIKFTYEKKAPYRDAFYFIIVCEGSNREPEYFRFFDGMSSRVKIVPVQNTSGSAPKILIENALAKEEELDAKADRDRLWFVLDTDRWREQLTDIRNECEKHPHWKVAQSNPCFEVWLYFHAKSTQPKELAQLSSCHKWKSFLPTQIQGGFNSDFHPASIETAIVNAKNAYQADGYFPKMGSTQVWELCEELFPLIRKDLDALKEKFPKPNTID